MNFNDSTYDIIGCAMRVHSALGPGLHGEPYARALVLDLHANGFQADPLRSYPVHYLNEVVGECTPGITVDDSVLIDTASIEAIGDHEIARMLTQLRIARLQIGLILNFRNPKLETKRVVKSPSST